jgi:AraC-like DNA-binding protein
MKVTAQHIPVSFNGESLNSQIFLATELTHSWHYHTVCELCCILEAKGARFVGNHSGEFTGGDLVLLGPNLPHAWSVKYGKTSVTSSIQAVSVYFPRYIFFQASQKFPELGNIQKLITKADYGVRFPHDVISAIVPKILELTRCSGIQRLSLFLEIMDFLSRNNSLECLTSVNMSAGKGTEHASRIQPICDFIQENFKQPLTLAELANMANMAETSFSRYFKKMTGKPFSNYVMEVRVGAACKSLIESDKSISEIAFSSGFNNLTHFNRSFLKVKGVTPRKYKRNFS